ncbi:MAG: SDR family NAD(P)-dependent oxidoreductase, partial [Pirellulales bacterium]|nr:SDR family NAD(P)-dependent oxidoreductase [Pirellulales bacterium]
MNEGLEGRTALVTGGARGIGRAICQRLGAAGANVVINYVSNQAAAEETAQQVEAAGATAHLVRADVA